MSFGVNVTTSSAPPTLSSTARTSVWHVAAKVTAGPSTPTSLFSLGDFVAMFATRTGNEAIYDAIDVFFREGGAQVVLTGFETAGDYTDALSADTSGPGNQSVIGEAPTPLLYEALQTGATATNRFALRDVTSTDTVADMVTLAAGVPALDEYGLTYGPWAYCPGPTGVIGAGPRTVPASAVIAALLNRVDGLGNPNRAAAGRDFPLQFCTGFTLDISDVQRAQLFSAGVNAFKDVNGVLESYGFQTNVPQSPDTPFWQANCSRGRMWLVDRCQIRGEAYAFKPLDAEGHLAGAFGNDITEECMTLYGNDGLYGATPEDAFAVNVGSTVNTQATAATATLDASVQARWTDQAKAVDVALVSIPVSGTVVV